MAGGVPGGRRRTARSRTLPYVIADAFLVLGGYLFGSLPFGYWVVRLATGEDIRTQGSGNIGTTNVWRVHGRRLGIPVALLDVAKGFAPTLVALELGGEWVGVLAGVAAMIGHARPVFLGFARGGKMVATAGGVAFALAPVVAAICLGIWILVFVITRYASVASMLTAAALPLLALAFSEPWPTVLFSAVAFVGVVVLHRQNIARLFRGTESRFTFRRAARA